MIFAFQQSYTFLSLQNVMTEKLGGLLNRDWRSSETFKWTDSFYESFQKGIYRQFCLYLDSHVIMSVQCFSFHFQLWPNVLQIQFSAFAVQINY